MLKRRCSYVANSFADVMQIGSHKGPKSLTFDRVIDHILVPWSLRRHVVNCGVAEEDPSVGAKESCTGSYRTFVKISVRLPVSYKIFYKNPASKSKILVRYHLGLFKNLVVGYIRFLLRKIIFF